MLGLFYMNKNGYYIPPYDSKTDTYTILFKSILEDKILDGV